MSFTVDVLKTFMHNTLLEQFPDATDVVDDVEVSKPNATLESAVLVANSSYNSLTANLPTKVVVRFDSLSYQVKTALVHVYTYVMQDHAILHSLSMGSMSLSENQVFEHYLALRDAEQKDLDEMRKELLDEIDKKDEQSKHYGAMLYHKIGRRGYGGRLP